MPNMLKDDSFESRRTASLDAKKKLLERFKTVTSAEDPAAEKRKAERLAIHEARLARQREKEIEKQATIADELRRAAEREAELAALEAERQAQAEAEAAEKKVAANAMAARVVADEAARKAARDARYAARKARKS